MKPENGKGSERRPAQVSESQIEDNWARVFGQTPETPEPPQHEQVNHAT